MPIPIGFIVVAVAEKAVTSQKETLFGGLIKKKITTSTKPFARVIGGTCILSIGLTELLNHNEERFEYYNGSKRLGESENDAAEFLFCFGLELYEEEKYDEALKYFNAADTTCEEQYHNRSIFNSFRIKATERMQAKIEDGREPRDTAIRMRNNSFRGFPSDRLKVRNHETPDTSDSLEDDSILEVLYINPHYIEQCNRSRLQIEIGRHIRFRIDDANFYSLCKNLEKINLKRVKESTYTALLSQSFYDFLADTSQDLKGLLTLVSIFALSRKLSKSWPTSGQVGLTVYKTFFIREIAEKQNMKLTEAEMERLLPCLNYNLDLVLFSFAKFKDDTQSSEIIDFFKKLFDCQMSHCLKEQFLLHILPKNSANPLFHLAYTIITHQMSKHCSGFAKSENFKTLRKLLAKFMSQKWDFKIVENLIASFPSNESILRLIFALNHVMDCGSYEVETLQKYLAQPSSTQSDDNMSTFVHRSLIEDALGRSEHKTIDQLMEEIKKENRVNLNTARLREKYTQLCAVSSSKICICSKLISYADINSDIIQEWATSVKRNGLGSGLSHYEMIAVTSRAMELFNGFKPREIQIITLLLLLHKRRRPNSVLIGGKLIQVNTGEGKTCIIAMFAVIMALKGHTVDVITSSSELAKPQCEQYKKFYAMFDLTASHNVKSDGKSRPTCKCDYKANIVYGAASDFQADILHDEYSVLDVREGGFVREGRECDVAIVDEVDSMLIDGRNFIVMLSSYMPGSDNLEAILALIWIQMNNIEKRLIEHNGESYLVKNDREFTKSSQFSSGVFHATRLLGVPQLQYIQKETEHYLRSVLRDTDSENPEDCTKIHVQKHLRNFVLDVQLNNWIESAMHAKYSYEENKHYIIRDGCIVPVDSSNTGIIQENMQISNGIHQFLQIKHGLKITPENLTTNYLSNVSFFRRYKNKIFGLTGTLGSKNSKDLLKKTYKVNAVIVPPFMKIRYKQLDTLFACNREEWLDTIAESCIAKLTEGRAVLVIMQYMVDVDQLNKAIEKKQAQFASALKNTIKVFNYKCSNDFSSVAKELKCGEMIIATNIAGRGTDIKVSEDVERAGGLHVCLTFLPINERVETQNFGRTSRTGCKGTGQFVLKDGYHCTLEELKKIRDDREEKELFEAEKEVQRIVAKDEIFQKFCKFVKTVRDKLKATERKVDFSSEILRSLEDRFAIWLKEEQDSLTSDNCESTFKAFSDSVDEDLKSNSIIKNPYFHVLCGNKLMREKEYDSAIQEYTRAIEIDDYYLSMAYYNRGCCRVACYVESKHEQTILEAIQDFTDAKKIIMKHLIPLLNLIQQASFTKKISEQIKNKFTLYGIQISAIETAIGRGEAFTDEEIRRLEEESRETRDCSNDTVELIEIIRQSKIRIERGEIGYALAKGRKISVKFSTLNDSHAEAGFKKLYEDEIRELERNGNMGSFVIRGKSPICWPGVVSLSVIAIVQIAVGVIITTLTKGIGSPIAVPLVANGISDILLCIEHSITKQEFNFSEIFLRKIHLLSLKSSRSSAGSSHWNWEEFAKKIREELSRIKFKDLLAVLITFGANKIYLPITTNRIMKQIRPLILKSLKDNQHLKHILKIDCKEKRKEIQLKILKKWNEILAKCKHVDKMSLHLAKVCKLLQLKEMFKSSGAIKELNEVVSSLIEDLKPAIDEIYSNVATPDPLLGSSSIQNEPDEAVNELSKQLCKSLLSKLMELLQNGLVKQSRVSENAIQLTVKDINESLEKNLKNDIDKRRIRFPTDSINSGKADHDAGARHSADLSTAHDMIADVERGGEIGFPHLDAIAQTIERPIAVHNQFGEIVTLIGTYLPGKPISVQFHESVSSTGEYWTILHDRDSAIQRKSDSLISAICQQTGFSPSELRMSIARQLKKPGLIELFANEMDTILTLKEMRSSENVEGDVLTFAISFKETT